MTDKTLVERLLGRADYHKSLLGNIHYYGNSDQALDREAASALRTRDQDLSAARERIAVLEKALDIGAIEQCARIAETLGVYPELNAYGGGPEWYRHGKDIARAIRARAARQAITSTGERG